MHLMQRRRSPSDKRVVKDKTTENELWQGKLATEPVRPLAHDWKSSHCKENKSEFWGSTNVLAIDTSSFIGQKKASLLGIVKKSAMDAGGVDVLLHVKVKTDDGIGMMDGIFSAVHSLSKAYGNDNPVVGYVSRETLKGKLLEKWDDRLKNTGFQRSDVTNGLSDLFSVKDQDETMNVKKARAYEALQKAHEEAINALKPGNKDAPELVSNLTKSAGTSIGLEFGLSGLNLNAKNDRVVKAKMIFSVSISFQNLQNQTNNPKKQTFSLLLADTVIMGDKNLEVVTSKRSKAIKDVAYSFNENKEEEEQPKAKAEANGLKAFPSKTTLRSGNREISKEELRRLHQTELAGGGNGVGDNRSSARTTIDLIAYKNVNVLPPSKSMMIQIDGN
ncbi:hypothetical protein EZV62_022552 [Acer yangbiense]|uniref:FACT complex subunit n=1 Tax=Acer yangbiense TaxID=1000413 RepID=A0A5C7H8F7_9ROSI|nr:hypothetical protein EZV62_022552 [Acer yangbiense]